MGDAEEERPAVSLQLPCTGTHGPKAVITMALQSLLPQVWVVMDSACQAADAAAAKWGKLGLAWGKTSLQSGHQLTLQLGGRLSKMRDISTVS